MPRPLVSYCRESGFWCRGNKNHFRDSDWLYPFKNIGYFKQLSNGETKFSCCRKLNDNANVGKVFATPAI